MRAEGTSTKPIAPEPAIFVDTHVHIHRCFDIEGFLDAAHANFRGAAEKALVGAGWSGVLCLTESAGTQAFAHLREVANRGTPLPRARWLPKPTRETRSLRMHTSDDGEILLVAGYQIRTSERLEVLAVGGRTRPPDGRDLATSVASARASGAIPIVPWGFGKWTGARRDVVRALIDDDSGSRFFLGDNSNRSRLMPRPTLFQRAEERGIPVVPGSDPLPMASEEGVGGRAGVILPGRLDPDSPAEDLLRRLADVAVGQPSFSRLAGIGETIRNQLRIQVRNRIGANSRMVAKW